MFMLSVMDYDSGGESDAEMDEDEEAEIKNDAALLRFLNMMQEAWDIAATAKKRQQQERKCPRHYTGNSDHTLCWFALKQQKLAANGQPSIAKWLDAKRHDNTVNVVPNSASHCSQYILSVSSSEVHELLIILVLKNIQQSFCRRHWKVFKKKRKSLPLIWNL